MSESDDLYVAGFEGNDQFDPSETLTGDNTEDPLDAGYSPPDHEPHATRFGTTAEEQSEGESLDQQLAEEEPDVTAADWPSLMTTTRISAPDPRTGRLVAPDEGTHQTPKPMRSRPTSADRVAPRAPKRPRFTSSKRSDMHLTKFRHSCVRLDDGDRTLVIDPGSLLDAAQIADAFDGADAVLITHEHADHVDVEALRAAATADPRLQVWAPASVATQFAELGDRVHTVREDETFEAAGFAVQTFGGQHAVIHPTVPVIPNVAYLIDEQVYHPGDSLIVPTMPVTTLLVPIHAPWSKIAEVIDFVVSVRARSAYQIHDGLLNDAGLQFTEAHVSRIGGQHGTQYRHLAVRETVEV